MRSNGALLALLLVTGLGVGSGRPAHAQDFADRAWREGDLASAERLYEARLEADPRDQRALHRLALMRAWEGRTAESLILLDRLLTVAPDHVDATRDRAKVLAWRGDLGAAGEAYEAILSRRPDDAEARLGLAQVHLWAGRFDEADALYRGVLAGNPRDPVALEGFATAAAWADRLVEAERRWRAGIDAVPDHASLHLGLARTLLWQGRPAAALETIGEALRLDPTREDIAKEHAELALRFEPSVGGEVAFERDSDDNRILETIATGRWYASPSLSTKLNVATRRAQDRGAERRATRGSGEIEVAIEPGWRVRAGAGADVDDQGDVDPVFLAAVTTPGRNRVQLSTALSYDPLTATARSIERDVTVSELAATVEARLLPGWRVMGDVTIAEIQGSRSNRRLAGRLAVSRRLPAGWAIAASVRGLGFRNNLDDGYFDPSRFWIAEVGPRWGEENDAWSLEASTALGVQRVEDQNPALTFRADATAALRVAEGEIFLSGGFATAGLTAFSTGEADYRYGRLAVGSRWRL